MIERRFLQAALRAESTDGKSYLSGYAASFNTLSEDLGGFVERILPGAFSRALREKQDIRCLLNHDASLILGRTKSKTLQVSEDSKGLRFRCLLPDTQVARDLAVSITRGDLDQCSFAFRAVQQNWLEEKAADGSIQYIREIVDCDLSDVSPVTAPAYATGTSVGVSDRSLFPDGMPAEVRSHLLTIARATPIIRRAAVDDSECGCDCPECLTDNCEACSNSDCQDQACRDLVESASARMNARCEAHGIAQSTDSEADRASRRRQLELAQASW